MTRISRSLIFVLMMSLALVVAACDDTTDDDADTTDDTDTTTSTDTDTSDSDDATEETVTEEDDDDSATDEADETEVTEDDTSTEATETTGTDDADADATATTETDSSDATAESDSASSTETEDSASGEQDADQILEDAADRAEELETAKFELNGTGQIEVEEIGEVTLNNAEGAVERPDRAQVDVEVDAAGTEVPLSVVSIDGDVYFTDVFSGDWQSAPDEFQFNPAVIFDEDNGIPALIRSVEDAEVLGEEEIDGTDTWKVYGVVDRDLIEQGTSGIFQPEEDVDFNVWIDKETNDVLKVLAEDPTDESDSTWEMLIFDHDEPVEIEDPDVDES